jgi:hypothetical protein
VKKWITVFLVAVGLALAGSAAIPAAGGHTVAGHYGGHYGGGGGHSA